MPIIKNLSSLGAWYGIIGLPIIYAVALAFILLRSWYYEYLRFASNVPVSHERNPIFFRKYIGKAVDLEFVGKDLTTKELHGAEIVEIEGNGIDVERSDGMRVFIPYTSIDAIEEKRLGA